MRLAVVTSRVHRGDGQGRVNYELVRHAREAGYDVSVVARHVSDEVVGFGVKWLRVAPRIKRVALIANWEMARKSDRILCSDGDEFDVIHGCGASLSVPHHVNTSHFVHSAWLASPVHISRLRRDPYGLYQWLYSKLNARWELQSYRKAQRIVAVSSQVRNELIATGLPPERIRVILNGVDLEEFRPGTADRASLGLPVGVPLALFVGDLRTPRKNLDTILKALAKAPGVHLAVVGRTDRSVYPQMARELGLAERVHFLGFRKDVPKLMQAADLFVFPSRYEACTLVLLEAIASGLPVISAETTGGSEVLGSECGVLLKRADDAAELAAAMQGLLQSPARLAEMAEACRTAAGAHSWANVARDYLDTYAEMAARN